MPQKLYTDNGKIWRVLYLANEPFERNWQILIWRLRRGFYSNDVAFDLAVFNLAINGQIRQITKLKLPPNFPVIRLYYWLLCLCSV